MMSHFSHFSHLRPPFVGLGFPQDELPPHGHKLSQDSTGMVQVWSVWVHTWKDWKAKCEPKKARRTHSHLSFMTKNLYFRNSSRKEKFVSYSELFGNGGGLEGRDMDMDVELVQIE